MRRAGFFGSLLVSLRFHSSVMVAYDRRSMSTPIPLPMRFESERMLWTIDDVYGPSECRGLVQRIEAWGPQLATNNPLYRDQDRVIRDEPGLAAELFERIKSHLPQAMGPFRLLRLNERLRFYRYEAGQRFPPHTDHWYRPSEREISLHTVLVYLNHDFEGGATRFVEQVHATVEPMPGRVAVFQHKLRHEGLPILRGRKCVMRSDVIFEADATIASMPTQSARVD